MLKPIPPCNHELVPGEVDAVNEILSKVTGMAMSFLYQTDRTWSKRLQDWVYTTPLHVHKMDLERYTKLQRQNDVPAVPPSQPCACGHTGKPVPAPASMTRSHRAALSEAWSRELRDLIKQKKSAADKRISVDPHFEDWE